MGYLEGPRDMKVIKSGSAKLEEPKKIVLTKLSRRTKILAYGLSELENFASPDPTIYTFC